MASATVTDLRCEHLCAPMGVQADAPRLSWRLATEASGTHQLAWQVLVSSGESGLRQDRGDLWDSGAVEGADTLVRYAGAPLEGGRRYWWKVRAKTAAGWGAYSGAALFGTGLWQRDWCGVWLGYSGGANGRELLARRVFTVGETLLRATLFISGLGYFEASLNGAKVGDHLLDPAVSDPSKRVYYLTHPVEQLLCPGENVLGIRLGNGWHGAPRFICQLQLEYAGGRTETLATEPDSGWQVGRGPIVSNSIFDGEVYDARLEQDGWDAPGFDFSRVDRVRGGWVHAMALEAPGGQLTPQLLPPIRLQERLAPTLLHTLEDGAAVYDAGRNMAGWAAIEAEGPPGAEVCLRFAENLYPNGHVNQENLRTALAEDRYILRGGGAEHYRPRYTYHGFRYVEARCTGDAVLKNIAVEHFRSDVALRGSFCCGDEIVNQIERLVLNTECGNLHGIPTDCPQRDERMGWLNDATVRAEESIYHFDMLAFYEKWMWDIRDTQAEDGSITDTAPFRFGTRPADPVGTSFLLIPWLLYLHYGDLTCLATHYEALAKWVDYLQSLARGNIIEYSRFGDWASPRTESQDTPFGSGAVSATTPGALVSTGYQYYNAVLMARFATLLGRDGDREKYEALAQAVHAAFLTAFFDAGSGRFAGGSQGAQAFPLFLGIVPPAHRTMVTDALLDEIERHGGHLSTGNQTTKYLLEALGEVGHADTALALVTAPGYPGWVHMLEHGATTVWERWEYDCSKEMNSHNHPMHGALAAWFFSGLAGIRPLVETPGFARTLFCPQLPTALPWAGARLDTRHGTVALEWRRRESAVVLELAVPPNTTAVLLLDSGGILEAEGVFLMPLPEEELSRLVGGGCDVAGKAGFLLDNGRHRLCWRPDRAEREVG